MILQSFGEAYGEICRLAFGLRGDRKFYNQLTQDRPSALRGARNELLSTTYFHNFVRGDRRIKRAAVIISGVHGIEGHAGHFLQCQLLREQAHLALPPDTGLILIHLVNPWGFSYARRVDENNVDVNRGCFAAAHGENTRYDKIRALVEPDCVDQALMAALRAKISNPEQRRQFFAAAVSGQWHRPTGIFYGGATTCQSGLNLAAACRDEIFSQLEEIIAIDIHTGLGPRGVGTVLCPLPSDQGTDAERTRAIFGAGVQFINVEKSVTTSIAGDFLPAMQRYLPNCKFTGVALEMGTTTAEESFPAMVIENQLYHFPEKATDIDPSIIDYANAFFRRTFAPLDDVLWVKNLNNAFRNLWQAAIQGLSK